MDFLVVDDDRLICEGIVRRLRDMSDEVPVGHIYARFSAEEALAFLAVTTVDVLITDIRMYEMDGLTLIAKAKTISPSMRFVIVTAHHELEYTRQALRMGVDDYLLKPYSVQTMRETIGRVSARHSDERASAHRRLNLALQYGMTRQGAQAQALFAEHGLGCPEGSLRMVKWRNGNGLSMDPPHGVWRWRIENEDCMLVRYDEGNEPAFRQWIAAYATVLGVSIGVSGPGVTLAEMAAQADQALSLAWHRTTPQAYFYAALKEPGTEATRRLIRLFGTLDMQGAREQLLHLLSSNALGNPRHAAALYETLYTTLTQLCEAYELDMPQVPPLPTPYTGLETAFSSIMTAAEQTISTMADEASLYPVSWAKRYVRDHLDQNIDMAEIARKLKMSYTYFSKLFKEQTGTTFSEYQQALRIQEAKRLLMCGLSISDIAQQVGYTSVYNFTRVFTKRCGIAPSRWRKQAVEAADRKT